MADGELPVGREGDIPECFPTTPLLVPSRPVQRSGPTRVYRVSRMWRMGGNGRHRCAQPPLPRYITGPGPDDRNVAPLHGPPSREPAADALPVAVVCAFPRRTSDVLVILDGRPLVVNTCSVREHVYYVISAFGHQFLFVVRCIISINYSSIFRKRSLFIFIIQLSSVYSYLFVFIYLYVNHRIFLQLMTTELWE